MESRGVAEGASVAGTHPTDLCSSSSSSLDNIICKWWDRAFPGRYFRELCWLDCASSDETEQTWVRHVRRSLDVHSAGLL